MIGEEEEFANGDVPARGARFNRAPVWTPLGYQGRIGERLPAVSITGVAQPGEKVCSMCGIPQRSVPLTDLLLKGGGVCSSCDRLS